MANRSFMDAVTKLWARLRLPPPAFGPEDTVTLVVEGTTITLAESRNGAAILISGSPGRLAADPFRRGEQVALLMRANLGFLVGNRAGVVLDGDANAAPVVRVEVDWRYQGGTVENLSACVEDVLQLIEFHRSELAVQAPARVAAPLSAGDDMREFIIRL